VVLGELFSGVPEPFHCHHASLRQVFLPAEFKKLLRVGNTVKVKVGQGNPAGGIAVDNGEGGAGDPGDDPQGLCHPGNEGSLSCPQVSVQKQNLAAGQTAAKGFPKGDGFSRGCGVVMFHIHG